MAKIIGVTVGTTTPRPDWNQKNEKRADFIKNKPEGYLPSVTEADDGKILKVVGGKWQASELPSYDGSDTTVEEI